MASIDKQITPAQHLDDTSSMSDEKPVTSSHLDSLSEQEIRELVHDAKGFITWRFLYQFVCISSIWLLFGFDVGIVSTLLGLPYYIEHLQGPNLVPGAPPAFTPLNLNLLIPVSVVGTATAPFLAPTLQRYLGRRKAFMFAFALCCLPGSFLQLFSKKMGAVAFGRAWNYFGISLAEQVCAPFIAEIVPSKYRATFLGASTSFNQIFTIITTVIGYFCSKISSDLQWKIPLAIQCAMPAVLAILMLTIIESPTWLIQRGRMDDAAAQLRAIRPKGSERLIRAELAMIVTALEEEEAKAKPQLKEIFSRRHFKRTVASSLVSCLTSCSGYSLTATFGVTILIQAGVSSPFTWQIGTAVLAFGGVIVGSLSYDYVGRRTLAVYGLLAVAAMDFIAGGVAFTDLKIPQNGKVLASMSILLSFVVNVAFASTYTLQAEVPTPALKELTIAYCTFWNSTATIAAYFVIPYLLGAPAMLGAKAYLIFGGCMIIGSAACYLILPETRGRTFVEIDELYEKKISPWRMSSYQCTSGQQVAAAAQEIKA